ncbi:hypothetical protein [Desulfovibrio sp. JC010]|uniref:hypothetical protein n=1 Tax=Desulfovibrio sp. JC010 TaxID=2593641 RepID=UPI0013D5EFCC|nr:hypothetical protein [Desulfovibrio sp. JC010]NDV28674.1 hypothetical protein [Desulfovibrio sp. JC010]
MKRERLLTNTPLISPVDINYLVSKPNSSFPVPDGWSLKFDWEPLISPEKTDSNSHRVAKKVGNKYNSTTLVFKNISESPALNLEITMTSYLFRIKPIDKIFYGETPGLFSTEDYITENGQIMWKYRTNALMPHEAITIPISNIYLHFCSSYISQRHREYVASRACSINPIIEELPPIDVSLIFRDSSQANMTQEFKLQHKFEIGRPSSNPYFDPKNKSNSTDNPVAVGKIFTEDRLLATEFKQ